MSNRLDEDMTEQDSSGTLIDSGKWSGEVKKVSFKPRPLHDHPSIPEPVESHEHLAEVFGQNQSRFPRLFNPIVEEDVKNADASRIGWILYYPANTVIPTSEKPTAEWVTTFDSEEQLFSVDTRWNVSIPVGTSLIAYQPFNHVNQDRWTVLPTTVAQNLESEADDRCEGGDSFEEIHIPIVAPQEVSFSTTSPCVQLLLLDGIAESVESRSLTTEEHQTVEKYNRAMKIYPDWYREKRDYNW